VERPENCKGSCHQKNQLRQFLIEETTKDDDGYPGDDLNAIKRWVLEIAHDTLSDRSIDVKAINISAYGATMVHIDKDGKPVTPLYNYLKPFPNELFDELTDQYGGQKHFNLETASPPLGMLNAGLQLYWLKKKNLICSAKSIPHCFYLSISAIC
jgi:L-fuculokinase